jgi:hypothetical protein
MAGGISPDEDTDVLVPCGSIVQSLPGRDGPDDLDRRCGPRSDCRPGLIVSVETDVAADAAGLFWLDSAPRAVPL